MVTSRLLRSTLLDPGDCPLNEASIGVALHLYQTASWMATTLDYLTYYTHQDLPLLGEAVEDLHPSAEKFFQYAVAQVEDEAATVEEREQHFRRFPDSDDDRAAPLTRASATPMSRVALTPSAAHVTHALPNSPRWDQGGASRCTRRCGRHTAPSSRRDMSADGF